MLVSYDDPKQNALQLNSYVQGKTGLSLCVTNKQLVAWHFLVWEPNYIAN